MLGQHPDDDIARVEQDGFLFVRRDLDEAKSPEQENSFNSQQCVTDFTDIATFRSKRIEQFPVIASHWPQHVRSVYQGGYEKRSLLRRDVILVERFLDMGQDQFDRLDRSAAKPPVHGLPKARHFPFERCVHQVIFSREAIDETALAYAGTCGDGVERETLATGFENHGLGGI